MKRSDAVKELACELILSWLDVIGIEGLPDFGSAKKLADSILTRSEKIGMYPPTIIRYTDHSNGNTSCAEEWVWEPEEDNKSQAW